MLELIEGLPGYIVGIAVSGRLTRQDCEDILVPAMAKSLKRHRQNSALLRTQLTVSRRGVGGAGPRIGAYFEVRTGRDRHRYRLGQAHR